MFRKMLQSHISHKSWELALLLSTVLNENDTNGYALY